MRLIGIIRLLRAYGSIRGHHERSVLSENVRSIRNINVINGINISSIMRNVYIPNGVAVLRCVTGAFSVSVLARDYFIACVLAGAQSANHLKNQAIRRR
jgi:hypothetical protein